jgi:hypothetical protein
MAAECSLFSNQTLVHKNLSSLMQGDTSSRGSGVGSDTAMDSMTQSSTREVTSCIINSFGMLGVWPHEYPLVLVR